MDKNNIHDRIENILKSLCEGLVEKDEAMRLALLAAVAGESIFFLGLPGTAKSMVSRRLKSAFKGENGKPLRYFEYLMNQFSTPDEIFGPVSLKSLEEDKYERIIKGYLPDAEVAFLDEIWKASPAIQNTLLTIINEKKFHNGNEVKDVPLKVLISASNELPAENQGLEALWDRFLIRLMVNPVQSKKSFVDLVCGQPVQAEIGTLEDAISIDELEEWKNEINRITIPDEVKSVIDAIHSKMWKLHEENPENNNYYISDRRWMKIVHLLKTSAFLNGREEVDLTDCSLIPYCIWNSAKLIRESKEMIVKRMYVENDLSKMINKTNEKIINFNKFVNDTYYEDVLSPAQYEMKDGKMAYRILSPKELKRPKCKPYYFRYNENVIHCGDEWYSNPFYYNEEKEMVYNGCQDALWLLRTIVEFNYNKIKIYGNNNDNAFTIKMKPTGKQPKGGVDNKLKEQTSNIYNAIDSDIKMCASKIDAHMGIKKTYESNLFADQTICDDILKDIILAKNELEMYKENLEKVRIRYTNLKEDDRQ